MSTFQFHHVPITSVRRTAASQSHRFGRCKPSYNYFHHQQHGSSTIRKEVVYEAQYQKDFLRCAFIDGRTNAAFHHHHHQQEKMSMPKPNCDKDTLTTKLGRHHEQLCSSKTWIVDAFLNRKHRVPPSCFRKPSAGYLHALSLYKNNSIEGSRQVQSFGKGGGESKSDCELTRSRLNVDTKSRFTPDIYQIPSSCNVEGVISECDDDNPPQVWRRNQNIVQKDTRERGNMAMSLLLDPIIGSPPSALPSPTAIEARDDISALSEGFTRKITVFRRRLSTSFDEPSGPSSHDQGGIKHSGSSEHVAPLFFEFKAVGAKQDTTASIAEEDDSKEKKAKLNAWLAKIHEEAKSRGDVGSMSGDGESGGDDGKGSSSNQDDDGDSNDSKSPVTSKRVTEDLFQLLDKVIGFKGRNISHITVEQSVKDLCMIYMDANEEDKLKFFTELAEKYGVDHDYVTTAAMNLASCKDYDYKLTLEEKLRGALVPKSQWLFTQIGRLENGVKFLVDLRTDLLDAIGKSEGNNASLKALNNGIRDLLGNWFSIGFLNLERVTWQSSCEMLQKISEYEAVHPMRNWTDLKKRVGPNRRCFVFTHNSMPAEPVVVLHTFLTDHIASSVQKIVTSHRMRMMSLDSDLPMSNTAEDPNFISTAIFYSITSTQRGLTGIELGNYLIKRVVRELQSEFPKMTQYSSLSPIPGFTKWLTSSLKSETRISQNLLTETEIDALKPIFETYSSDKNFYQVFLDLLKVNTWFSDPRLVKELEKPLMRLCAQYLFVVKRRGYALDPVAHFHLKNGAVMWRLNWLGDESPRGLGQSCGMMVNYRYFLDNCENNSQNYMENQVIQASDQMQHLVKLT
ncbi:Malonyl-CoA decarboxylase, mitochondrial [Orchesella cincta]|uniref:Malonyl-CoA decarboxylase, mitochondrial n=1 Tax=Orchesella cincta TaxID=48709 RepID=A0A1D2MTX0_ORCCI|nr:Malonyl-CoA decarboxylase, mitochondrial [Orchesella cincta]